MTWLVIIAAVCASLFIIFMFLVLVACVMGLPDFVRKMRRRQMTKRGERCDSCKWHEYSVNGYNKHHYCILFYKDYCSKVYGTTNCMYTPKDEEVN